MKNWKKLFILASVLVLLVAGFVFFPFIKDNLGLFQKQVSPPPSLTEDEVLADALPLCEDSTQIVIRFETINRAYEAMRRYSIFREQVENSDYLVNDMVKRTFQFLSKPVPDWAQKIADEEIRQNNGFNPASLAEKIYNELLLDSQYQDLASSSGRNSFVKASINALIKAINDPFAGYTPPEEWVAQGREEQSTGSYRGMGISLSKNERGEIIVDSVRPGTPAEKAGLAIGDAILTIDGKRLDSCSIVQFIYHIKLREDPHFKMIVKRKRTEQLQELDLTLERIKVLHLATYPAIELPSGRGSTAKGVIYNTPLKDRNGVEQDGIVYIEMKEFSTQVASDLYLFLQSLDYAKVSGIIIDLRKNPGGLMSAINDTVDYFLVNEDLILHQEEAIYNPFSDKTFISKYAIRQNKYNLVPVNVPVAILVSRESFSGSELFSGALRDHDRAVIISRDERTGGKGTVNRHFELAPDPNDNQGALYIAIGWWRTPSGELIELRDLDGDGYEEVGGLKPDVRVEWIDEDYNRNAAQPAFYDPTLFEAVDYIQREKKK